MKHLYRMTFATVAAMCLSYSAFAHDPALHADAAPAKQVAKPKPSTCEQLADSSRYSVDLKDAQTKALKERCDAQTAAKKK
jgi:hypothetical protein